MRADSGGIMIRRRRVCLVIGSLSGGGIATSVMRLGEVLRAEIDLDLIVLSGRAKDVVVPEGAFKSVFFLDRVGRYRLHQVSRGVKVIRKYMSLVRKHRYDCAVAFGEIPGLFGALGKWFGCHKFVASLRTDWESQARHSAGRSIVRYLRFYFLAWFVYTSSDYVVGVTEAAVERLSTKFGIKSNKVKYIYNCFNKDKILSLAWEQLDEEEVRLFEAGSKTFVAMGRLIPQKGFDVLLQAFSEIVQKGYKARLVIIGKGKEKAELLKLAHDLGVEDVVKFVGFRSNPYRLIKNADAFVLSSRWEGIANAMIESLICQTPVIATDCPAGPKEILTTNAGRLLGALVEAGNSKALAEAMKKHIDSGCPRVDVRDYAEFQKESRLVEMEREYVGREWTQLFGRLAGNTEEKGESIG